MFICAIENEQSANDEYNFTGVRGMLAGCPAPIVHSFFVATQFGCQLSWNSQEEVTAYNGGSYQYGGTITIRSYVYVNIVQVYHLPHLIDTSKALPQPCLIPEINHE